MSDREKNKKGFGSWGKKGKKEFIWNKIKFLLSLLYQELLRNSWKEKNCVTNILAEVFSHTAIVSEAAFNQERKRLINIWSKVKRLCNLATVATIWALELLDLWVTHQLHAMLKDLEQVW